MTVQYDIHYGEGYQDYYKRNYFEATKSDAQNNDPKSYFNLAEYYRNNGDYENAKKYYEKSFKIYSECEINKYSLAYYYLGYLYQYGYGIKQDKNKALEYYTKYYQEYSKYKSNPEYLFLLGKLYESGYCDGKLTEKPDYKKAAIYYSNAAELNFQDAYYRLGYVDAIQEINKQ